MREIVFFYGTEILIIRIVGTDVYFKDGRALGFAPINFLKFNKEGVIKEFPDLKDRDDWREEGMKRFMMHLRILGSESQIEEYIINDLTRHGYVAKIKTIAGFRPEVLN